MISRKGKTIRPATKGNIRIVRRGSTPPSVAGRSAARAIHTSRIRISGSRRRRSASTSPSTSSGASSGLSSGTSISRALDSQPLA